MSNNSVRRRFADTNNKNRMSGFIRAVGWFVACLGTYGWGLGAGGRNVLFLLSIAVLVEAMGLGWSELCEYTKSGIRKSIIAFELMAGIALLALYVMPAANVFSIYIGGISFFSATAPIFGESQSLNVPKYIYLVFYFAPVFCALLWAAVSTNFVHARRKMTLTSQRQLHNKTFLSFFLSKINK